MVAATEERDVREVDSADVRKLIGQVGQLEGQNKILIESVQMQHNQTIELMKEQGRQDRENYRLLDAKFENVREDLTARIDASSSELGARIDATDRDLGARIDVTSSELGARIGATNRDLGARIDATSKDLGARIDVVRTELSGRIDANGAKVDANGVKIDKLREDMTARIDKVRDDMTDRIDTLRADMDAKFSKQTNLQLLGLVAIIAAVIGTGIFF